MKKRALIIDDDLSTLELMKFQLEAEDFFVITAENGSNALDFIKELDFDIILTDLNLPDINGIEMVRKTKEISPSTEIIMITGYGSTEKAVEATKAGAFHYVEKPVDFDELILLIHRAIERKSQALEIENLRGKLSSRNSYVGIIGGSKSMQNVYEMIESVAESDANILILGESGTGKELIANAIHFKSSRAKKDFVKVNCAALPKDLIESELFGHIKGSFTGAAKDKLGFIGKANNGSLMLDEIGEMPVELQPKLLRVLQERVYYAVGSDRPQEVDFRLISATNRNPLDAIQEGVLREDLYFRINTIEIHIPPLRERMDDVPMLAEHFLKQYAEKYRREIKGFSQQAYDQMLNYGWRGNIRELQHSIERAVLLAKGKKIEALSIQGQTPAVTVAVTSPPIPEATPVVQPQNLVEKTSFQSNTPVLVNQSDSLAKLEEKQFFEEIGKIIVEKIRDDNPENEDIFNKIEYGVVLAALHKAKQNKQAAANLLGVYRPRLYGMIKRHNLENE
ncbi:MAG TPA: sigma-54 dependent transcriptional regulator [Pyrinomonadaceae bacterium]|nr:sigma-54 dependent transcriptional regulator [Pyrinomonadaceae bacterium]